MTSAGMFCCKNAVLTSSSQDVIHFESMNLRLAVSMVGTALLEVLCSRENQASWASLRVVQLDSGRVAFKWIQPDAVKMILGNGSQSIEHACGMRVRVHCVIEQPRNSIKG